MVSSRWYMRKRLYLVGGLRRQRREAGQDLPLEQLEAGAAAGGAAAHLVGELRLRDDGEAVAAADDGRRAALGRLGHRLGHREAALRERRHLEDAHRAVPEDGLRLGDVLLEEL